MSFAGINSGLPNNWAAINFTQAAAGSEDAREKNKKNKLESDNMNVSEIVKQHRNELNKILFNEFQQPQVIKGQNICK